MRSRSAGAASPDSVLAAYPTTRPQDGDRHLDEQASSRGAPPGSRRREARTRSAPTADHAERDEHERRQLDGEREAPKIGCCRRHHPLVVGDRAHRVEARIEEELNELRWDGREAERRGLGDLRGEQVARLAVEVVSVEEEEFRFPVSDVDGGQSSARNAQRRREIPCGRPRASESRSAASTPRAIPHASTTAMNSKLRVSARSASSAPAEPAERERVTRRREPQRVEGDREERREEVAPGNVRPVPRAGREHERDEGRAAHESETSAGPCGQASARVTRTSRRPDRDRRGRTRPASGRRASPPG